MPFAQLVLGSPGSGKSTFCDGMHQFMGAIGRKCSVVNLDPANDHTNYPCALDIRQLVTLEEIMADDHLGPNGGILYAIEELENNFEWLEEGLKQLGEDYIIFDCPGQVELYTHHNSLRNVFLKLQKIGFRLVVVHLSDSICVTQPSLYISNVLLSLRAMIQMDLPHVNILTKIDKIASYDPLPFNLDYYTEVQDLSYLQTSLEEESPAMRSEKWARLNRAVAGMIESFGLVRFEVLSVENKKSMMHILRVIDRAGGYVFGGAEGANDTVWQVAMRNESSMPDVLDIQERWVDNKEAYDKMEDEEDLPEYDKAEYEEDPPEYDKIGHKERETQDKQREADKRLREAEGRLREAEGRLREAEGGLREAEGGLREDREQRREAREADARMEGDLMMGPAVPAAPAANDLFDDDFPMPSMSSMDSGIKVIRRSRANGK